MTALARPCRSAQSREPLPLPPSSHQLLHELMERVVPELLEPVFAAQPLRRSANELSREMHVPDCALADSAAPLEELSLAYLSLEGRFPKSFCNCVNSYWEFDQWLRSGRLPGTRGMGEPGSNLMLSLLSLREVLFALHRAIERRNKVPSGLLSKVVTGISCSSWRLSAPLERKMAAEAIVLLRRLASSISPEVLLNALAAVPGGSELDIDREAWLNQILSGHFEPVDVWDEFHVVSAELFCLGDLAPILLALTPSHLGSDHTITMVLPADAHACLGPNAVLDYAPLPPNTPVSDQLLRLTAELETQSFASPGSSRSFSDSLAAAIAALA